MKAFVYSTPGTLDEALALLDGASRPLAGGTDLLTLMKAGLCAPERLVSVRSLLPRGIAMRGDALMIGAATTLADIERDALVQTQFAALAQAAAAAASPQLRNMATIGGNLLQRPRCWYFRHPDLTCWLKGGHDCLARHAQNQRHALFGDSPCVAVHPSDLAVALTAFGARVRVKGPSVERALAIEELFALPAERRRNETTLDERELVVELELPVERDDVRSIYLKAMDRAAFSFALVSVAAVVRLSRARKVDHVRVVLGGVAPIPWRAHDAERILAGSELTDERIEEAARTAVAGAKALAHNAWKIPLARTLAARALRALVR